MKRIVGLFFVAALLAGCITQSVAPDPGILRVDPDDAEGVAAALTGLYDDYERGELDKRKPSEELVRKFDASVVAKHLLNAIKRAGITKRS